MVHFSRASDHTLARKGNSIGRARLAALVPALAALFIADCPAAPKNRMALPDFTKGDPIPAGDEYGGTVTF